MTTPVFNPLIITLVAALGYLCGNLQTSLLVSRLRFSDDVRKYGSGNAGATNMFRVYGRMYGLVTFAGDALKCIAATILGWWLGGLLGLADDPQLAGKLGGYLGGFCAIVGHCYPALFKFHGGKGAASSYAFLWLIFPLGAAIATVAAVVVYLLTKRVSMVSITGALLFVILSLLFGQPWPWLPLTVAACAALVLLRHIPNIRRLITGEEKETKRDS
ncbi:MAG: glycerol-3-phosphate acyltransferase [Clostridiales bacterium]|nr:glycerol-3-phosphate acyltransferase [Clostridiales bacterium]